MKKEVYLQIRSRLRELIHGSEWEGHVFCVGGCVRDELMSNEIKDIDLVIDLPSGGIRFAEWMYENGYTIGKVVTYPVYSTAMFVLKEFPEVELECVQTRKEKYPDAKSRNPETAFGSIEEDCMRRDLTINALYRNITTGELLDITCKGVNDIRDHIIRTTTDPEIIFDDDPLRILRCIRFATRYGWEIEKSTMEGMKRNAVRLEIISRERIMAEFDKMLTCRFPVQAMELLRLTGAMHFVIPELEESYDMTQNHYHCGTVWQHTMMVLDNIKSDKLHLRMAALLHDIGKICTREETAEGKIHFLDHEKASADLIDKVLRRLKYPNELIRKVQFLALHHMDTKTWKDDLSQMKAKHLRKLQYICWTEERFNDLLLLIDADNNAHAEGFRLMNQVRLIRVRSDELKQDGSDLFEYRIPFDGKEIMELRKMSSGPEVKSCQDYLLKLAFVTPLRSREEWTKHLVGYRI